MAKFESYTFGKIRGKHGTAVAAKYNDKSILRVYNPPSNPNSPAQLAQRVRFSLVVSSLNPLRNIISIGFNRKRGYSEAVAHALRYGVTGTYPNLEIDYSNILVSSGTLPRSIAVSLARESGTTVTVTWNPESWLNGTSGDRVHLCFLNVTHQVVYYLSDDVTRNAGNREVTLPDSWTDSSVYGWIFFSSPGGELTSMSQPLGLITL